MKSFSFVIFLLFCSNLSHYGSLKSISNSRDATDHHLGDSELLQLFEADKKFQSLKEMDYDMNADLGEFLGGFFHESQAQLVLDLDLLREIWAELRKFKQSTAEGDVDYVQSVIDFFEPLQEYDISAPCLADFSHFLYTTYNYAKTARAATTCSDCNCTAQHRADFHKFQWIFNVVDSMGKVPAAVVSGNNLWTGSWQTCRKISALKNRQGQSWNGQYCMARFQPYNRNNPLKAFVAPQVDPAAVCRSNASHSFEEWSAEDQKCFDMLPLLNLGLCLPDQCTNYDTQKILQFLYNSVEVSTDKKLICNVDVQCSNSLPEYQLWNDTTSMLVLCFVMFVLGIILFGTCYDNYVARPLKADIERLREKQIEREQLEAIVRSGANIIMEKTPSADANGGYSVKENQLTVQSDEPNNNFNMQPHGLFVTIILMFSVTRNIEYIMSTSMEGGQIRCLHGARFFGMCWVIFGHTYYYICTSLTTDNLLQTLREFPKYFYNQLVVQAPLAVDSFFFLSGLLTAYIFLLKLDKNQIRLNSFATWSAYFFRRYLRLTPVYVVVMVLEVTLLTYVSEGPFWRSIEKTHCRNSWWTNLIYMNNFLMQDDPCMGWTWYLANDFQLYAFAPILIILLHKYKIGGVIFGVLLLVASSGFNLFVTLRNGYPPAPLLTSKLQIVGVLQSYWVDLYVKPYIRCGPYIIGCLVGDLLVQKGKKSIVLSVTQWIIGWSLCIILGIYSVFGLYYYTKTGEISNWWAILYTLAGRPSFALALAWITFACETNHGETVNAILGHKMFVPLSKLTFCAYLLHPILLQLYYLSRPNAFHFTHSFQLLLMFFAAVFMSYAAALLLSLAVEMPCLHVDKLLFGGREARPRRKPQANTTTTITDTTTGGKTTENAFNENSEKDAAATAEKNDHSQRQAKSKNNKILLDTSALNNNDKNNKRIELQHAHLSLPEEENADETFKLKNRRSHMEENDEKSPDGDVMEQLLTSNNNDHKNTSR